MQTNEQHTPQNAPQSKPGTRQDSDDNKIPQFDSPDSAIAEQDQHKTTIVTDINYFRKLKEWHGRSGTFKRTVAILVHKLVNALDNHEPKLDKYDPDTYEHLVLGAAIVLPGDPTPTTTRNHHELAKLLGEQPAPKRSPTPIAELIARETNTAHVVGGVVGVAVEGKGESAERTDAERNVRGSKRGKKARND